MNQFRNIDRSDLPQVVQITFERRQKPDDCPDLSHLQQDYCDVPSADAEKYKREDAARITAYDNGEWEMRYLWVRASVMVPIGGNSFTCFEIDSAGCGGIESDSDEAFEQEIWADQEVELKRQLSVMGTAFSQYAEDAL